MTDPTVTPAEPADQPERKEQRAKFVAGLREFATWLEERPWAPIARPSGYDQPARLQIDLFESAGLAEVREIGDRLGVKAREELHDRTAVDVTVGSVAYSVIAWHPNGRLDELERLRAEVAELRAARTPLVSDETIAAAGRMGSWNEREGRWDSPTGDDGFGYSREADDPTPVSPARHPLHNGGVVDGGQLVDETPAEHYETGGWKSTGPGSCGVECVCGVTYDGFDTIAEAGEHLDRHIASEAR